MFLMRGDYRLSLKMVVIISGFDIQTKLVGHSVLYHMVFDPLASSYLATDSTMIKAVVKVAPKRYFLGMVRIPFRP